MSPSAGRNGSDLGRAPSANEEVLVKIPVEAGEFSAGGACCEEGRRSEDPGIKPRGRRPSTKGAEESKARVGGPIRREKGTRSGGMNRKGSQVREKKKGSGVEGEWEQVGTSRGPNSKQKGPAKANPNLSTDRGGKGKKKTAVCCWGSGTDPEVLAQAPSAEGSREAQSVEGLEGGASARSRQGGKGNRTEGAGEGGGGSEGELGSKPRKQPNPVSPSASSPLKSAGSRSPIRRLGNLFGSKPNLGGSKGGQEEPTGQGHGDLVKKIRGAVKTADEGGPNLVKDRAVEGGGREPSA